MRVLLLACLWLIPLGCNLEKGKCLEACKTDHQSASAGCEASDDPVTCKQKADATKTECTKKCEEK
jgi:hypothetical protein